MLDFHDYTDRSRNEIITNKLPITVKSVTVCCDGGRLEIFVNGESFYQNMGAGTDFSVQMDNT